MSNSQRVEEHLDQTNLTWFEKFFKIKQRGSSVKTEIVAGVTSFLTLSYILLVNPKALNDAGIPLEAAIGATIFAIIIGSLLYGLLANLPIVVGPGVGLNAFFAYTVVLGMGLTWQTALGAVFISGVVFLILTVTGVRKIIIKAIPDALKYSVVAGIGMFLAFIGLKSAGVIMESDATFVTLGNVLTPGPILATAGLILAAILTYRNVTGGLAISIVAVTIASMVFGVTATPDGFSGIFSFSIPDMSATFMQMDIMGALKYGVFSVIFSFVIVDVLDNSASLIALATKADLMRDDGTIPNMKQAFYSDGIAIICSAALGSTATNAYSDNAAGIAAGGRTGLTALVAAACFGLSIFILPLITLIPGHATAPVLIIIGAFMLEEIKHLNFDDFTNTIPAFLTMIMMPLTYSIANGIAFGFISYSLLKVLTGKHNEVHWMVHIVSIAFVISFFT